MSTFVRSRSLTVLLLVLLCLGGAASTAKASAGWLIPPVDGAIVRPFAAPYSGYSAGHRGVDFAAPAGTAVRAAGDGEVHFAGGVAGVAAVSIDHGDGLRSTYSTLSEVSVTKGERVTAGTWIGRVGSSHLGQSSGLHFGVKVAGGYVDPELHLGPLDASAAVRLEPVEGARGAAPGAGACPEKLPSGAPNDNVAVAVAGIGSRTAGGISADMYERGPELLGYPAGRSYRFSYRGVDGPALHEPYEATDTLEGVAEAAVKLGELMRWIAKVHPGAEVDLIAHSQGGIVARAYLTEVAREWDPELPRVENLVTFSSPHSGAPLAGVAAAFDESVIGKPVLWVMGGVTRLLDNRFPDPGSRSVLDLAPHSPVMDSLGRQDILYGTRALAVGTAGDLVVPADRTALQEETSRWVDADGFNRHSSVVGAPQSLSAAHAFLRGATECIVGERSVPLLGRFIGGGEWGLSQLVRWGLQSRSPFSDGP